MARPRRELSARTTLPGYRVVKVPDGWDIVGPEGMRVGPFNNRRLAKVWMVGSPTADANRRRGKIPMRKIGSDSWWAAAAFFG